MDKSGVAENRVLELKVVKPEARNVPLAARLVEETAASVDWPEAVRVTVSRLPKAVKFVVETFVEDTLAILIEVPVALVNVKPWKDEAPFVTVSVEETVSDPVDSRFVEETEPREDWPVTASVPVNVPEGAVSKALLVVKVNPADEVT